MRTRLRVRLLVCYASHILGALSNLASAIRQDGYNTGITLAMVAIESILAEGLRAGELTPPQWSQLMAWELADRQRAIAWQINPDNVSAKLQARFAWLQAIADSQLSFPIPDSQFPALLPLLWQLWLPLALQLKQTHRHLGRPFIQGILGGQGTGKTTLTQILGLILAEMGLKSLGLSIDDLYKTYAERQALQQQHPRLIWRGPPGTHDIELGIKTLTALKQPRPGHPLAIPRFDKSLHGGEGDRIQPEITHTVDIVLFEGWFVGIHPIAPECFDHPPPPINTDGDRQFALAMNQRLNDYLPLWALLDRLLVLCPQDYRLSQQWRRQAEHTMKAKGKAGMSDQTIDQFVEYFWQAIHPSLFLPPLIKNPRHVNLVIEVRADHTPSAVYCPQEQGTICLETDGLA